jgi:hypothetical protein
MVSGAVAVIFSLTSIVTGTVAGAALAVVSGAMVGVASVVEGTVIGAVSGATGAEVGGGGSEGICNYLPPCCHHHHHDAETTRDLSDVYPAIRGAHGGVKGILAEHVEPKDLTRVVEETRVTNQTLLQM